jgi:hypothetical protein
LGFSFGGAAVRRGVAVVACGRGVERVVGAEAERDVSVRRGRSRFFAFFFSRSEVAVGEAVRVGSGVGVVVARSWIGAGVLEPPAPPTSAIASAATAMQLAMVRV